MESKNTNQENRKWIYELKVGDKIDIKHQDSSSSHYWSRRNKWQIASIITVVDDKIEFYDNNNTYWYYKDKYKNDTKNINIEIEKLHTHSAYHTYLNNPSFNICYDKYRYINNERYCNKCNKLCCTKCSLILLDDTIDDEMYHKYEMSRL